MPPEGYKVSGESKAILNDTVASVKYYSGYINVESKKLFSLFKYNEQNTHQKFWPHHGWFL